MRLPSARFLAVVLGLTESPSEVGTLTIPVSKASAAADDVERGCDLTLDAAVLDASSIFGPGSEAENAIDGDTSTEWPSSGDGDEGFITIDLGSPQEVAGIEFLTRSMLDGTATTETFTGQEVRFDVDASTGGNVGAIEVNVFAPVG